MNQGENAPPMHPRCRCTIVASIDDGKQGRKTTDQRAAEGRSRVPADMSYRDWLKSLTPAAGANDTMSAGDIPSWPPRDKAKVLSKEDYHRLRDLAEANGIALAGVKSFDGVATVVREVLETLIDLKNKFPAVSDTRHKLTLSFDRNLSPPDFAITRGRVINLNENAYRDVNLLQSEYRKAADDGWFVRGTTYRAIPHHEFGHVLTNVYKLKPLEIACEVTGLKPEATLGYLKTHLSRYAGEFADGGEIAAEVLADMSTGSPGEFSRKFYTKILKHTGGDNDEHVHKVPRVR